MKGIILFSILSFFAISFIQGQTILYFHDSYTYELSEKKWEIDSIQSDSIDYHIEYILNYKRKPKNLSLHISSMDYHLKDSVYSDLPIEKKTVANEFIDLKADMDKEEGFKVEYSETKEYKGYSILSVTMSNESDSSVILITSIGLKIVNDYLAIGPIVLVKGNYKVSKAEKLLKKSLLRLKANN